MRALFRWHAPGHAQGWQIDDRAAFRELTGPVVAPTQPFTEAIPSWAAATPGESWVDVALRVRQGESWSGFYQLARWDDHAEGSRRTSLGAQRDAHGRVDIDTLAASAPCAAAQARIRLYGQAALHSFSLALSAPQPPQPSAPPATGVLAVPPRSQLAYADGAGWCSPTSVTMVLGYWHQRTGQAQLAPFQHQAAIPQIAAPRCYDPNYEGTGNWAFNTAFAATAGLDAYAARLHSLADLAPLLRGGVPPILSIAWEDGQLDGATDSSSGGHLIVLTGLDDEGGAHVADPAAPSIAEVHRRYRADQLERVWQGGSQGLVYIIHPHGWVAEPKGVCH